MNPSYFWKDLKVRRRADADPVYYEQGRVLGGGSSVNGQVALRGAPEDYDRWHAIGAKGWLEFGSAVFPAARDGP